MQLQVSSRHVTTDLDPVGVFISGELLKGNIQRYWEIDLRAEEFDTTSTCEMSRGRTRC